jgi:hypothetical protein
MVQVIENHAEISGELLSVAPHAEKLGFVELQVRVAAARNVDDWPNLFVRDVGETIVVVARENSAAAAARPGPVTLRVKKTGPGKAFAEE